MLLDESCLENLFYRYSDRLLNYASHYIEDRSLAMDLVQEAFVKFWETYNSQDSDRWHPVLFRIVRNKCLDYLRKKIATIPHSIISHESPVCEDALYALDFYFGSSDNKTLYEELSIQIDTAISSLPVKCREVFEMSRFMNMKNKEIAEELGISVKTVEKHITHALKVLKHELEKSGYIDAATCATIILLLS